MRRIRIISTPPGEAPEDIRKAWVGLVLPLSRFRPRRKTWGAGVLTGPKTLFGFLTAAVSGRLQPQVVYVVVGHIAVDILATHSPDAAAWWREHAPHVLRRGWRLCFAAEVCEEITGSMSSTNQGIPGSWLRVPSDIFLFRGSLLAVLLSAWTVLVVAARWPRGMAGYSFAGTGLLAPVLVVMSILEAVRYRRTWRVFAAMFLSLVAVVTWSLTVIWVLRLAA
jgi:hypothetical protein